MELDEYQWLEPLMRNRDDSRYALLRVHPPVILLHWRVLNLGVVQYLKGRLFDENYSQPVPLLYQEQVEYEQNFLVWTP